MGSFAAPVRPPAMPEAIAQVGDTLISTVEYQAFSEMRIKQIQQQYGPQFPIDRKLRARFLEELINNKLLLMKAQSSGITITPKEVDADIGSILETLPPRMTLQELLQQQRSSLENFRNEIHDKLLLDKYTDSISVDLKVEESAIKALYESWVQQGRTTRTGPTTDFQLILCKIRPEDPGSISTATARIEKAQQRIKDGEDFQDVVLAVSDEPNVSEQKGVYRESRSKILSPTMNEALASLEVGEVSEPFQTPYGINLVKVLARHEANTEIPYATMRDTLEKMLSIQAQQERIKKEIDSLRLIIHIEVFQAPKSTE